MARKQARRKAAARKGASARRRTATSRGAKAKTRGRTSPAARRKAAGSRLKSARPARKAAPPKAVARKPARTARKKSTKADARKTASTGPKPAPAPSSPARKRGASTRSRQAPSLERSRRQLHEVEDNVPTPPSSLDLDRSPSAARSGRAGAMAARSQHNETSPELTGGDVDADWEDAYAVGDEAPGGDNPTPDQDRVDDIGRALGVEYQDNEELKASEKISQRDKHRWELDPASAEDYNDRDVE